MRKAFQLLMKTIAEENRIPYVLHSEFCPYVTQPRKHIRLACIANTTADSTLITADDMLLAQEVISQELDAHIVSARRLFNSYRPLNSLPQELLIEIMQSALKHPDKEEDRQTLQLQAFAQVSHRWWRIVVSSPSLWRIICLWEGSRPVELALKNSGNFLLDIATLTLTRPSRSNS